MAQLAAKTSFNYEEFTQRTKDLKYQGDAFVPKGQTVLSLTKTDSTGKPQTNSIGRAVYSPAVNLWQPGLQANFHTSFKFFITNVDDYPADGIAFFIAPVDYPMGSDGGGLGIYNDSNSGSKCVAVEFDTHKNSWDPNSGHIGINVNSHKSQAYVNFDAVRKEVTADVDYDASTKQITVKAATSGTKPSSVTYDLDLKSILPPTVQVGISAATGNNVATHDLISWSFTSTLVPDIIKKGDTTFSYEQFTPDAKNLKYQGDAFVPPGQAVARLTKTDKSGNPQPSSVGRVVYIPEVQFWQPGKQANFETTFKFFIKDVNNTPADGIVFFIAPANYPLGSAGGSLGIYNECGTGSQIFAVEFDTYKNGWDPSPRHVGININSRTSKVHVDFDSVGKAVIANIKYNASTKKITVKATSGTQTSSVEHVVNLKDILPQKVQVGISAATGLYFAVHDLISWSFTSTLVDN